MVYPGSQRGVRLAHGGWARCLSATGGSQPAGHLSGRDQSASLGRCPRAAARRARTPGTPRSGVRTGGGGNCFLVTEPLRGWRQVQISERRTRLDFAHCIKDLVEVHYPAAERIVLVMDQLNTHSPASLYDAFPPAEAKRLADKLARHYTPKHGSWLTMAEIELSVLQRQCLARRFGDRGTLEQEVAAWATDRNGAAASIDWRFTTADARIKLKRLYPLIQA